MRQKAGHDKASVQAKVEHPFRVIKRQFGGRRLAFAVWPRTRSMWSRCLSTRNGGIPAPRGSETSFAMRLVNRHPYFIRGGAPSGISA